MDIILYYNNSPVNKISKSLTEVGVLAGSFRGETGVVTPVFDITSDTFPNANYVQIPAFGRYYFIREVKQIRASVWQLQLKSDPLMSFDLSGVSGILVEAENSGSPYLQHDHFVRTVKSKTDIVPFPNGLLDTGEYILITAGGVAAI